MSKTILNIAGGKILPLLDEETKNGKKFITNLDLNYFHSSKAWEVEYRHRVWNGDCDMVSYCNHDVYEFLENYTLQFDIITIYRFMEHVPLSKLLYFIYLLSTITKIGGEIDVIVPDAEILSKRILNEKVFASDFQAQDILTTTEFLNEPPNPHASLWTRFRCKYYFELEGRFEININDIISPYDFDGRNIYLRFFAKRIK